MPLTTEEQAYYDQLMGDKAEKSFAKEHTAEPDASDNEAFAKSMGINVDALKADVQKESQAPAPKTASGLESPGEVNTAAFAPLKGIGMGVADVVQNTGNFVMEILDGVENMAAKVGLGTGDLINDSDRINWSEKLGSPEDSLNTRAVRHITKYAAPVLATMGAGGGMAAGLGAGAAADILMLDPHQARLSTMLRDEVPSLKNYPTAMNALNWLANKPDETALTGRFKNMIEGLGVAAPIVGAFSGIVRGFKALNGAKAASKLAAEAPTTAKAGEVLASEAELAAGEAKMGSNVVAPEPPPQGDLFAYGMTKDSPNGPVFNLNNDSAVAFAVEYAKANPQGVTVRGPKAFSELDAQARGVIESPEQLEKLLSWKLGERPLTDAETKASQYLMSGVHEDLVATANKALASGTPEDLLHFQNMIDTFSYIDNVKVGAGSEAGRALNAHKIGADLSEMSVSEFNKSLGQQGRQKLAEDAIRAAGGDENVKNLASTVKAISELSDADVAAALRKAAQASKGNATKFGEVMQSVALNGMLSSPKTWAGNMVSNALTTANSVLTNYVATGIGFARNTPNAVRLKDANGYVRGLMGGLFEGIAAAGQALKTGSGGPANAFKADYLIPLKGISTEGMQIPVEEGLKYKLLGKVVDGTGLAVGLPTRINATADAFWGTVLYRGKVYQAVGAKAERLGLKGAELKSYMQKWVKDPPVDIHEAAKLHAQTNTFSKALEPGSVVDGIDSVIEMIPQGRVILPFFKTSANLVEYSFVHSPLAGLSTSIRSSIVRGGVEGDMALAKIGVGSMFLGAAAWMATEGTVTGPAPSNYRLKQALEESGTGWQPDSIKVGEHYVSYAKIQPFNSVLRLGAVMAGLRNYVSADEYAQLVPIAAGALADFMSPEMMVDSFSRLFEGYNEAVKTGGPKAQSAAVLADIAGRYMPYSSLQRDIKNEIDPLKGSAAIMTKDSSFLDQFTDRVINRYKSISPWLSEDLPVQRNIFGEALVVPDGVGPDMISPFAITTGGGSELVQKLQKLAGYYTEMAPLDPDLMQLPLSLPSRTWTMNGVSLELTPAEYERYVMYSAGVDANTGKPVGGATLRMVLEQELDSFKDMGAEMTPVQYNKMVGVISKTIMDFRKVGQRMMTQDTGVMDRWKRALDATMEKKTIDTFR